MRTGWPLAGALRTREYQADDPSFPRRPPLPFHWGLGHRTTELVQVEAVLEHLALGVLEGPGDEALRDLQVALLAGLQQAASLLPDPLALAVREPRLEAEKLGLLTLGLLLGGGSPLFLSPALTLETCPRCCSRCARRSLSTQRLSCDRFGGASSRCASTAGGRPRERSGFAAESVR